MTCLFGRTESPIDIMASYDFIILHINQYVDIHSGDPNSLQLGKHSSSIGGCEPQNEAKSNMIHFQSQRVKVYETFHEFQNPNVIKNCKDGR